MIHEDGAKPNRPRSPEKRFLLKRTEWFTDCQQVHLDCFGLFFDKLYAFVITDSHSEMSRVLFCC